MSGWHPRSRFTVVAVMRATTTGGDEAEKTKEDQAMSDTGDSDPQFAFVPGTAAHRFAAAPIAAAPGGQGEIASELGAMADAMEHLPFTAETLAARLEADPDAARLAAIAGLALALRDLSPSDAATVNRILAEGPRPKKRERKG